MGGRLALIFSVILKQRLQSLVSHRLAALVLGFNLISTELFLPASPSRLQNKNSTEPKLEADSGADVSSSLIYVVVVGFVAFFVLLGGGVVCFLVMGKAIQWHATVPLPQNNRTHTRKN